MANRLSTVLSIDEIRVKAHHGWYEAERILGCMYSISIKVHLDMSEDEDFSDLETSVNYEQIYDKVITIMKQEHKLIEHCCKSIYSSVKELRPSSVWEVLLTKENPPIKYVGNTSFKIKG